MGAGPDRPAAVIEEYDRPVVFYLLATAVPWVAWFAAAQLSGQVQTPATRVWAAVLGIAGLVAPVGVAAWLIVPRPRLRADVAVRLRWPRGAKWYHLACAVLLLPVSILVATAVSIPFGSSPQQFLFRGGWTFSAGLLPVWVTLVAAAVLEELAWHSYGTDTLVRRLRVLPASLVFSVIWTLWHLPLSFIQGYYHNEVVGLGWLHSLNFVMSVVVFVVLMNWLYFRTGRSILVPIVFHISANFANEVFATEPDTKIIQTALLLLLCVVVIAVDRDLFLGRRGAPARPGGAEPAPLQV